MKTIKITFAKVIFIGLLLFAVCMTVQAQSWTDQTGSNVSPSTYMTLTLADSTSGVVYYTDWNTTIIPFATQSGSVTYYFTGTAADSIAVVCQKMIGGNTNLIDTCFTVSAKIKGSSSAVHGTIAFAPSNYGDAYRFKITLSGNMHGKADVLEIGVGVGQMPTKKRYDDKYGH